MTLAHKVQKEAGRVAREQSLSPQVCRLFGWQAHLVEGFKPRTSTRRLSMVQILNRSGSLWWKFEFVSETDRLEWPPGTLFKSKQLASVLPVFRMYVMKGSLYSVPLNPLNPHYWSKQKSKMIVSKGFCLISRIKDALHGWSRPKW